MTELGVQFSLYPASFGLYPVVYDRTWCEVLLSILPAVVSILVCNREAIIEQAEKKKKEKQDWRDLARRITANILVLARDRDPSSSSSPPNATTENQNLSWQFLNK